MTWTPMSELEIWDKINRERERMGARQRKFWDAIRIEPEKWIQSPYGNEGEGFWVVAIIGRIVVWFNDIEDGFNKSTYTKYGFIQDYHCNQDTLEEAVQDVLDIVDTGHVVGGQGGPPTTGAAPGLCRRTS